MPNFVDFEYSERFLCSFSFRTFPHVVNFDVRLLVAWG